MDWQVGQQLICDRNGQLLTDCVVQSKDFDSIVIFCASNNIVVCGKQKNLENLGWRVDDRASTHSNGFKKTAQKND